MDKNRPNNARKVTDNKNPTASRPENDENKQPSQTTNKNGVRQTSDKRADSKKPDNSASVLAKGPQATAEQLRMAQMSQVASASDIILAEKIKQVKELTQCTDDDAATALHDTGNDTELAVNQILEGGTNKSEWETTGKKGKKKPKAKQEELNDSSLQDSQFVGYVSGSRINSTRGRQAHRNTSSRGGRGGAAQSAPRTSQQEEPSNFNGGSQRTFPPGDRPSSPQAGRPVREDDDRARGPPDGKKPDQERMWGEDADDDWKESIRETKVFTRSSPNAPSSNSVPQQGPSRVSQPSTGGSNGPSFSAMVQKQSQQSAWTNSNVPTGSTTTQRVSVSDTSNWKQPPSTSSKAPPSSAVVLDHMSSAAGTAAGVAPQSTIPTISQKESNADVSQMGLQFGNLAFNRTSYEARNEPTNQVPAPSQSQTYNSRPSFVHSSRDQASNDQASNHRPTALAHPSNSSLDSSRSHNVGGLGSSGFAVPSQTLTFGHSEQDAPTNTYSAKNIKSTPVLTGSQQTAPVLPSRSPGGNFAEQRSSSGPAVQPQNPALSSGNNPSSVTSMQDSRFGQQSTGNVLSKSPQVPINRPDVSSFGQQTQQKPQGLNQSPIQTEQFSQSALHQTLPAAMRQAVQPGYAGYGLSTDSASRQAYSAFSSPAAPSGNASQKDATTGLQQQSQLQSANQLSSTVGAAPRTSSTATSVFNTASKPLAAPTSSLSFKPSTYATQPSPSNQSLQQQYLQQGQQQYGQQASLPMFPQMYGTGLEGMTDPRLQSVTLQQPGLNLEYGSYQNSLTGRDPSGLGYSAADPAKYRNDPMAGVQTQVSQQQALVGPHLAAPYQSYIQYSPAAVPQNYGYGPTPVYPTNIPSAYGKGGASLGSNYPGSSYQDMSALTDVNKVSNAYGTTGLRGFGNEGYLGNPGILTGAADLQSAYYGNKAVNKFDKPSQNFGMHLPGGQQTSAGYGGQYYPPTMMQQQQLHQMGQVPQNSAGQNLANAKQNKATNQSYGGQNWGNQ